MPRVALKVELLNYTQNPEETIALAAKLCYSDAEIGDLNAKVKASDTAKFIDLLTSIGHASPLEHASFSFGIEGVSRALLAQITRHRIASFSVKSQRYVSASKKELFNYILPPQIEALGKESVDKFDAQMRKMQEWYNEWQILLGGNCESSNENARFVLPNAAETKLVLTMNARELMHFFNLRCCNRAQWEIRALADEMLNQVSAIAPNLFKHAGASCVNGACPEGTKTCGKMKEMRELAAKRVKGEI